MAHAPYYLHTISCEYLGFQDLWGCKKASIYFECWNVGEKATEVHRIKRSETTPASNRFGKEIVILIINISLIFIHCLRREEINISFFYGCI